jgi:hypothetical protein
LSTIILGLFSTNKQKHDTWLFEPNVFGLFCSA